MSFIATPHFHMLVTVLPTCRTPIITFAHEIRFNALCHLHSWIITIYGLHGLHHPHFTLLEALFPLPPSCIVSVHVQACLSLGFWLFY